MAKPSKRVLIMDDYTDSADSLAAVVEMCGHKPLVAYDAKTALRMAYENLPDIFILDLSLPVSSGYYVARHLRGEPQFKRSLIVALTGFAEPETKQRALKAGFDMHVSKPISGAELRSILRAAKR